MIFSEILVLFLALVIAITLVLMLRKLFFGRKSKIQIDKKVNSRELFEPVGSENSEREVFQDNDLEKLSEDGDLDSGQEGEIENTQSEMLTLHLENSEESKFSYDSIKKFLGSNKIEYNDEGGWFKILIEENDSFLLINGLNPGKFIPEDGLLETQVMTLVYSFKPKANSVSAFSKMIDIAQLMAENFQSEILDSDRNNLTKQMVDHYSQIAEEFDLKNLA
ncbi:MAG: cell division protein ZipA C-terminal FtsZ-binding domain-containing protein [Pseudomonadota bacterium]|nr:cell division protein ZipA C-terminal FtsZ-binding domain-containing protein [Pseudomonadota bacterium]